MPYTKKDYLDPIHIIWRSGKEDDPYVDRIEYLKVVNQKIVLAEIPDRQYRVRISGLTEVNVEKMTKASLSVNEYAVDYASGFILVHEEQEALTLNVKYKGRGFIQYPSNRIYHEDKFNDVVLSLEDIINRALKAIDDYSQTIDERISDYYQIKDLLLEKLTNVDIAITDAKNATELSKVATDLALDAYDTTRLVFQPYVTNFNQINLKYPNPKVGWTVQVYETGIRYRWDGIAWIPIDLFGGNIANASLTTKGLMSKETFKQLQDLELSFKASKAEERVMVFCFPYVSLGVNNLIARFPFKGEIMSIRAVCLQNGSDSITEIDVEQTLNFTTWTSVLSNTLITFEPNSHVDDGKVRVVAGNIIDKNHAFRVNVHNHSQAIEGLTIEMKVKITQ